MAVLSPWSSVGGDEAVAEVKLGQLNSPACMCCERPDGRSVASLASPTRSKESRFGARTVLPVDSVDVVCLFLVYGRRGRRTPMLFSIQTLIAVAVTLGIAVVWTMAIAATGAIWQRREIREFMASHPLTIASQDSTQADDARELVLR